MYDTRTIFGSHIVARDHAECLLSNLHKLILTMREDFLRMLLCVLINIRCGQIAYLLTRLHPWHQLLVVHTYEVSTLVVAYDAIGQFLAIYLVDIEGLHLSQCLQFLTGQISLQTSFGNNDGQLLTIVRVEGLCSHIVDVRTYTESRVRRQSPRRSGPCHEGSSTPLSQLIFNFFFFNFEHTRHSGILHVTVATRLIQLVARKARTCSWRIRLDGISLIEQALLIELLQEPPQGLDVAVIVSDIRVVEIYPVAHLMGQFGPLLGVLHDLLTAGSIVVIDRDFLADVLLGDAEHLLHAELYRQTVGIPTGLALHLIALHGLEAAENILDRTSHYVVNTWHTVCRRWTLVKHERRMALTCGHRLLKDTVLIPTLQDLFVDLRKVELVIFCVFHISLFFIFGAQNYNI